MVEIDIAEWIEPVAWYERNRYFVTTI